jgi:1-acyl-sn-glycerol-3-phosphate acyltransferase
MVVWSFIITLFFWTIVEISIFFVSLLSFILTTSLTYLLARYIIRLIFFCCFIRIKVVGQANLTNSERIIYFANKPDLISTFALIAYFPCRLHFVADRKMFKQWFLGRVVKAIGSLPDVKAKTDAFGFISRISSLLKKSEAVLIYPANLRRWDKTIGSFGEAEIKVAKVIEADIIPLVIKGTSEIIKPGEMLIKPGKVIIVIKEKLQNDDNISEKLNLIYQTELGG